MMNYRLVEQETGKLTEVLYYVDGDRWSGMAGMEAGKNGYATLLNIEAYGEGQGKGTVLLNAVVTWALAFGTLSKIKGVYLPKGDYMQTMEWYEKRGVQIRNCLLRGELTTIQSACAQIMARLGLSYMVEPRGRSGVR